MRVIDCSALQAELAEIDENLIRNELTELQQGIQLKRRKDIYLEFYPETGHGKATKNKDAEIASFSEDTAKKTGKAQRTIERKVSISKAPEHIWHHKN